MDFGGILGGIDAGQLVLVLVAAAAILGLLGFAKWGAKKVARFFDPPANASHAAARDRGAAWISASGEIHSGSNAPKKWVNPNLRGK